MSGSGSVYHPSKLIFELGIGPSLLTECGLKVKCALMRLPVLTLWSNLLGLSLTIHLVTTLATGKVISLLLLPNFKFRPESRQGDPPNLSILISGGKENNCDALSNGE